MNGPDLWKYRLPRGRHDLSAAEIAANQRSRLIEAAAALVASEGIGRITARAIALEAGVSPSTLYELFAGADGVVTAGAELAATSLSRAVEEACGTESNDREKLAVGVVAACEWAARNPGFAALLALAPAVAIAEVATTRDRLIGELSSSLARLARGRGASDDPEAQTLMVSAAVTLVSERAGSMGPESARALGLELAELLG
jgi:AcrR family transcriptional regulator